ncbi:ATP-binding protein [Thermincola ferriacetica]
MNKKINRKTIILINLVLGQALIVVINGMWGYYGYHLPINIPMGYISTFSIIAGGVLGLTSVFLIDEIYRLSKKEAEAELNALRLKESLEFVDTLRANRHDFLNHIQVIYGLAQLGKISHLESYIKELTRGLEAESRICRLNSPELAALLLKKVSTAAEQQIRLDCNMNSDLSNINIPVTEVVSIIGNLLDNALYVVRDCDVADRTIKLTISEELGYFKILVANNGPPVPEEIKDKIFEKGFTTKRNEGSGLGLYIVKSLAEKYGGKVQLTEQPGFATCFEVLIPSKLPLTKKDN